MAVSEKENGNLGRPSLYNNELAIKICERIANGESLRAICKDEGFPNKSTVLKWIFRDNIKEFIDQYDKAREIQAQLLADEIVEIADTPKVGVINKLNAAGEIIETKEEDMLGHRRLQVDSRKWYLSKVLPKVYGDKIEHSGPGGGPFVVEVVKFANP